MNREKVSEGGWKLLKEPPFFVIAVGLVLVLVGAGLSTPWGSFSSTGGWWLVALGVLIIFLGLWIIMSKPVPSRKVPDPKRLDVQIAYPKSGARLDANVDVHGTLNKDAAARLAESGYQLMALRAIPQDARRLVPAGHVSINDATGRWEVIGLPVGGEPGRDDMRSIEIWAVGGNGRALLDCWTACHKRYAEEIKRLAKPDSNVKVNWLPPIPVNTDDMIRCATIDVYRK